MDDLGRFRPIFWKYPYFTNQSISLKIFQGSPFLFATEIGGQKVGSRGHDLIWPDFHETPKYYWWFRNPANHLDFFWNLVFIMWDFTISTGSPDVFHQQYILKMFSVFFWVEWLPSGGSSHLKSYLLMGGRLAPVIFRKSGNYKL